MIYDSGIEQITKQKTTLSKSELEALSTFGRELMPPEETVSEGTFQDNSIEMGALALTAMAVNKGREGCDARVLCELRGDGIQRIDEKMGSEPTIKIHLVCTKRNCALNGISIARDTVNSEVRALTEECSANSSPSTSDS